MSRVAESTGIVLVAFAFVTGLSLFVGLWVGLAIRSALYVIGAGQ